MTAHHDIAIKHRVVRDILMGLVVLLACAFITCYLLENNLKNVVINYNGHVYGTRTLSRTFGEFLSNNNLFVNRKFDFINVLPEQPLDSINLNTILIKTAVPVTFFYDEKEKTLMTYLGTIREVMEEHGIPFYERDYLVGYHPESPVSANMKVQVVRVTKGMEVKTQSIPFSLLLQKNQNMAVNETIITREGVPGKHTTIFEITYEDGREVQREIIFDEVVQPPVSQVIEYGTIAVRRIPGTDQYFKYFTAMNMVATAYTLCPTETGGKEPGHPAFGITFSGLPAQRGVIAVDPRVIPLGTKVYVESLDGRFADYGMAIAADTGSAIRGNRIDLFMDCKEEAIQWGIRTVRVYIIHED